MDQRRADPRGALVRPYAVTRGRTEPRQDIALEAVLTASPRPQVAESRFAGHDKYRIATVCEGRAQSLAEIAAYTRLPLGVARVLVADMVAESLLTLHSCCSRRGVRGADGTAWKGAKWTSQAMTPRGAAGPGNRLREDRRRGRLRRRQDDTGRGDLRDHTADHRGVDDRGGCRASTTRPRCRARRPPRSPWTSAGSPWPRT